MLDQLLQGFVIEKYAVCEHSNEVCSTNAFFVFAVCVINMILTVRHQKAEKRCEKNQ